MAAMVVAQGNNGIRPCLRGRQIVQSVCTVAPAWSRSCKEIVFDQECLISLRRQATDVPELLRISDHNCALGAVEEGQCRRNVTLTRFVNHEEVELCGGERDPPARRKRCNRPA